MIRNVFFITEDTKSKLLDDYKNNLVAYKPTDMKFNDATGYLYINSIYSGFAFYRTLQITESNKVMITTEYWIQKSILYDDYVLKDIDNDDFIKYSEIKKIIVKDDLLTTNNGAIRIYTEQNGSKLMYEEGGEVRCIFALLNSIEKVVDYRKGNKTIFTEGYMKVANMTQGIKTDIKPDWFNITMEKIIIDASTEEGNSISEYVIEKFINLYFFKWVDLKHIFIYGNPDMSILDVYLYPEEITVYSRYDIDKLGKIKKKWKVYKFENKTIYVEKQN